MGATYCPHDVCTYSTREDEAERCWKCEPPTMEDLRELRAEGFKAGLQRAAEHVKAHSCVSSCCDANPSANEAQALADCILTLEQE